MDSPLTDLSGLICAMHLKDRIKEALDGAGISAADLARATKSTNAAVTFWLNGATKTLKGEKAAMIELATGYNAQWIISGKGEKKVATATVNITAPSPTLVATGSASNQAVSTVVPAQAAINNVSPELAEQCRSVMAMLATLPDDPVVRFQVLGQLAEIIAKARGSPPSHQESPAYSHAAIRAA